MSFKLNPYPENGNKASKSPPILVGGQKGGKTKDKGTTGMQASPARSVVKINKGTNNKLLRESKESPTVETIRRQSQDIDIFDSHSHGHSPGTA